MRAPASDHWWLTLLTAGTMLAFAANSLLARLALQTTAIDPATFTATRLITGALTLALIVWWQRQRLDTSLTGWISAGLLFIYAAGFSYAYRGLDTGTGALLLFASAQLLMMGYGLVRGERLPPWGLLLALGGLVVFLWPGTAATPPPPSAVALMLCAGLAWGGFSLLGRASQSPVVGVEQFCAGSALHGGAAVGRIGSLASAPAGPAVCQRFGLHHLSPGLRAVVLGAGAHDAHHRRHRAVVGAGAQRPDGRGAAG